MGSGKWKRGIEEHLSSKVVEGEGEGEEKRT